MSFSHGFSMNTGRNLCCYNIYTDFYNKKKSMSSSSFFPSNGVVLAASPIISLGTNCALIFLEVSLGGESGSRPGRPKGGATSSSLHKRHLTLFFFSLLGLQACQEGYASPVGILLQLHRSIFPPNNFQKSQRITFSVQKLPNLVISISQVQLLLLLLSKRNANKNNTIVVVN